MMREFDKLSFRVRLEMVRNLDWTDGTWPARKEVILLVTRTGRRSAEVHSK